MADLTPDAFVARCPSCDVELARNVMLCVACGYHIKRGIHLATAAEPSMQRVSDTANPYHSPTATTSDGSATFLSLFWFNGRIPRWKWWVFLASYLMVILALGGLLENSLIPEWVVVVVFWIALWFAFVSQVKRWHDLDKSGLWCLVNLIPILGSLFALIELGFQCGTDGVNEYGEDPLGG